MVDCREQSRKVRDQWPVAASPFAHRTMPRAGETFPPSVPLGVDCDDRLDDSPAWLTVEPGITWRGSRALNHRDGFLRFMAFAIRFGFARQMATRARLAP